jgi:hypothetical protein
VTAKVFADSSDDDGGGGEPNAAADRRSCGSHDRVLEKKVSFDRATRKIFSRPPTEVVRLARVSTHESPETFSAARFVHAGRKKKLE